MGFTSTTVNDRVNYPYSGYELRLGVLYEGPSRVCKHLAGAFFVAALVERLRGGGMVSDLPGDEVLAVFPRLADLIRHQEVICALHSRGSRVKVGLRLDDEADICEHTW